MSLKAVSFKRHSKRHQYRLIKNNVSSILNLEAYLAQQSILLNNSIKHVKTSNELHTLVSDDSDLQDNNKKDSTSVSNDLSEDLSNNDCVTRFENNSDLNFNHSLQYFQNTSDAEPDGLHDENEVNCTKQFLRKWALKNNVTHTALSELLAWFSTNPNIKNLPVDARTLLRTPKTNNITQMGCGKFIYLGLKTQLCNIAKELINGGECFDQLDLDFNVDGLPIHKSTNESFWPILCKIRKYRNDAPFPVAIFCGALKPPLDEFLRQFVEELSNCAVTGLLVEGKLIPITIKSFCCDAPARSFLKNVKGHNGYYGCDKCTVKGEYLNKRMTYSNLKAPLRSDEQFALKLNEEHHKEDTPLSNLAVGLVSSFPIDYMHCVCLGVVRKLLFLWRDGNSSFRRISRANRCKLDETIKQFKNFWPIEFNRKPRPLTDLERWKATEFRQFLLYVGPILLVDILPKNVYSNFMLLKFGITILLNPLLNRQYNNYANQLLNLFVKHATNIYGNEFCIYNTHALIHLANDAQNCDSLNDINCFPFENYLGKLKRMLRKSDLPLEQVVNRIKEDEFTSGEKTEIKPKSCVVGKPITGVEDIITQKFNGIFYRKAHFKGCVLSNSVADNCVYLKSGEIVKISCFVTNPDLMDIGIICQKLQVIKSFTTYPTDSKLLSMCEVADDDKIYISCPLESILYKGLLLPYGHNFVVTPILHYA